MNKFKLFLILMLSTILCIPKVDAVVNINGSIFTQTPQLSFYDNTNGILTERGAVFNDSYGYYFSNNSILTTGGNTYGANVTFTANEGFVAGYTYSLSILIGTDTNKATPSSSRICTAENIYNANTRYQQGYPCTNAISITSMDGIAGFNYNGLSFYYTILTYVFTPDFTSPTITLTYNTAGRNNSRHYFGGYHLEVLSDNKTGVSASQVQSIINNSGLASADSVEELQTEINNVKEDINEAENAIVDSNKETQDVIKDQFNSCRDSKNLWQFNTSYSNTNSNAIWALPDTQVSIEAGTYTFSADISGNSEAYVMFNYKYDDLIDNIIRIENSSTINFTSEVVKIALYLPGNTTIKNIMFEKGSTVSKFEKPGTEICNNRLDETNDKLNETNQQIGDLNNNITSSDTSSSEGQAGSFFENFNTTDNGGISSIVTAPLVAIDKMLSGTCSPLTATYKNKNISLPCGDSFWVNMPEIQNFLNIVLGGFLCYGILSKLYLLIDRLKNPEDDRVDVMKL